MPTIDSFRIDPDGISVDHVEWFERTDFAVAILKLQKFKKEQRFAETNRFTTSRSGKFAILLVGKVGRTGAEVVEKPIPDNPAHALIQRIPNQGNPDAERRFKTSLLAAIESVHPAWPPDT